MPCMAKRAYRLCERNVLAAATSTAKDVMNDAALVVKSIIQNVPTRQLENVEYPLMTDTWTFFRKSFFSNFIQGHWETSRLGNDVQVLNMRVPAFICTKVQKKTTTEARCQAPQKINLNNVLKIEKKDLD
ncbi:hypothetical protein TNCT_626731 [Trichonephila clavata]|uniref:Uncharacterized protein n=1 Tax=Trichonephila clavata TaxID=2740835 RepID=A0A8X6LWU6_TRICU|nr:hypothetical protein TNCT_626731 [Trichonephila clavata]